jgi:hypothetical protein
MPSAPLQPGQLRIGIRRRLARASRLHVRRRGQARSAMRRPSQPPAGAMISPLAFPVLAGLSPQTLISNLRNGCHLRGIVAYSVATYSKAPCLSGARTSGEGLPAFNTREAQRERGSARETQYDSHCLPELMPICNSHTLPPSHCRRPNPSMLLATGDGTPCRAACDYLSVRDVYFTVLRWATRRIDFRPARGQRAMVQAARLQDSPSSDDDSEERGRNSFQAAVARQDGAT